MKALFAVHRRSRIHRHRYSESSSDDTPSTRTDWAHEGQSEYKTVTSDDEELSEDDDESLHTPPGRARVYDAARIGREKRVQVSNDGAKGPGSGEDLLTQKALKQHEERERNAEGWVEVAIAKWYNDGLSDRQLTPSELPLQPFGE